MIALAKRKADGKTGIDAHGSTGADKKVTTGEVAGDGGGLLLGKIAGTLVRTEGGGGGGESAVGILVVLMGEIGRGALDGGIHGRGGEGYRCLAGEIRGMKYERQALRCATWRVVSIVVLLLVLGLWIWIGASSAQATLETALNKGGKINSEWRAPRKRRTHLAGQNLTAPGLAGVAGCAGSADGGGFGWIKRYQRGRCHWTEEIRAFSGRLLGLGRGLLDGLGAGELGYILGDVLLLKLLLELLSIDRRRGVLGRFVCGDGRHIRATEVVERADVGRARVPTDPARLGPGHGVVGTSVARLDE